MNKIVYRPGGWQVVVEETGVIAVPGDASPERVAALGRMLQDGSPALTEVIDLLSGGSITALGSFAVALTAAEGTRFAVRGEGVDVLLYDDGTSFSGADVTTWSERFITGSPSFELRMGGEGSEIDYPVRSAVVLAGLVRVGEAPAEPSVDDDAVASDASVLAETDAVEPEVTGEEPVAETEAVEPDLPAEAPVADASVEDVVPENTVTAVEETVTAEEPVIADEPAAEEPATEEPTADEPIADVPVAEEPVAGDEPDVQHTLIPEEYTFMTGEYPTSDTPAPPAATAVAADLPAPIDLPAPPPPAAPAATDIGDHDGATISLAEARRLRSQTGPGPEAPTEVMPVVDAPGAGGTGRIRMSTGQVLELDRPVIIGRRPRSTRASGATMPHLVAVESPQQDISRSHLEIRPEGDSVVVIDLHTTNGSTLLRPGADPMRLHPGEHTLVLDGDTVDLGDGVTVVFEGLT